MSTNKSRSTSASHVNHHTIKKGKTAMSSVTPKSKATSTIHRHSTVHPHSSQEESAAMSKSTTIESAVVPVPVALSAGPTGAAPTASNGATGAGATGSAPPPVTGPVAGPVPPPPPNSNIPVPPTGYTPPTPGEFRGIVPRNRELTALAQALVDLSRFADYDTVMGNTAPARADVIQALTTGSQWTTQFQSSGAWQKYAGLMQGLSWQVIRTQEDYLRPAFALAAKRNPALAEKYTGLAKLLAAPSTTAQKAVATKKANKKNVAEGKPPTHGVVGKTAQKKAQKAAYAAQQAADEAAKATPVAAPPAPAAPVSVVAPVVPPPAPALPTNGTAPVAGPLSGSTGH